MECSSGVFKVSTELVQVRSTGLLVAQQGRFTTSFLLDDASLEGASRTRTQLSNSVEIEVRQAEGAAITVNQHYHPVSNADRKDRAFVGEVLVPTGGQIEMRRHLGKAAEKETAALSQIEKDRWLIECNPILLQPFLVEPGTTCQPAASHRRSHLEQGDPGEFLFQNRQQDMSDLLGVGSRLQCNLRLLDAHFALGTRVTTVEVGRRLIPGSFVFRSRRGFERRELLIGNRNREISRLLDRVHQRWWAFDHRWIDIGREGVVLDLGLHRCAAVSIASDDDQTRIRMRLVGLLLSESLVELYQQFDKTL